MGLENPSLWWEVHLVCPPIDAAGFMVAGLPGLVVGHTPGVAWGITNVMVDDVDFYIERFNPDDRDQ
jgi:penicillin amidase